MPSTDWMSGAWGIFTHYLADVASAQSATEMPVEAWNERVESFDVERLVEQVDRSGAHWYGITLGQNSGYYCSPNATYDELTGIRPSKLSRRDLVGELAEALAARGIRTMAYLPSAAPSHDRAAIAALRCTPPWDCRGWSYKEDSYTAEDAARTDERLSEFQGRWEAIIREWSLRWGDLVSAWWFDGVYFADRMYKHDDAPNFASFAAAAKAGNPDSLVAWNPGWIKYRVEPISPHADYTAGEADPSLPVCPGRWVENEQWHVLTFLGRYWGQGEPRWCDEFVYGYTKDCLRKGGALTYDVPIGPAGELPAAFLEQLRVLGRL